MIFIHLRNFSQKCKQVLIQECGLGNLTEMLSKLLLNETCCLLNKVPEKFLGKIDLEGTSFLLYKEDKENVFCVFPYFAKKQYNVEKYQIVIDSYVREHIHSTGISMFLTIYSQIDDDEFALYVPKNTLAFNIDDFTVITKVSQVKIHKRDLT